MKKKKKKTKKKKKKENYLPILFPSINCQTKKRFRGHIRKKEIFCNYSSIFLKPKAISRWICIQTGSKGLVTRVENNLEMELLVFFFVICFVVKSKKQE